MLDWIISLCEHGYIPDPLLELGARNLVHQRHREQKKAFSQNEHRDQILSQLSQGKLAQDTAKANEQHYEVPAAFFEQVLGPNLKYSCSFFETPQSDLADAEHAMLQKYIELLDVKPGMRILELGCGWGSLTLAFAKEHPDVNIWGVSNSASQKQWIMQQCEAQNIQNIEIITQDINQFEPDETFDRVVSIEMFEHLRNYKLLFEKLSTWLNQDGKLVVHVFCHKEFAYLFETQGDDNWLGKYFFTGGVMPSVETLPHFAQGFDVIDQVWVDGTHYQRTARAWRQNLMKNQKTIMPILEQTYGTKEAPTWFMRWKMFFVACEQLFCFRQGSQWGVTLYRFGVKD